MRTAIPAVTAIALASTLVVGCGARSTGTAAAPRPALVAAEIPASGGGGATVSTTGTGNATVIPDTISAQFDVHDAGTSVSAALSANDAAAATLQSALEHHGVAAVDIQTSGLSVYAQRHSYGSDDSVTVTLRDLATAGSIIDAALGAVGNAGRLDGVSFAVSNEGPALARARAAALSAARTAAGQLATAEGLTVTGLRSITENDGSGAVAATSAGAGSTGRASAVPLQAGSQQVTATVTAVWSLGR